MSDLRELLNAKLGHLYVLDRELGGGAMSRVFLAEERRLGRKVVLKVLTPELAEGISAERFAREIQLAARLQQANIVPVLTTGRVGTAAYYTMPYISGESLRHLLAGGPVPIQRGISILRDILRALAFAHAEGVVHRDVKPENVLLSGDTAVVTDFGIAKALAAARRDDDATLTQIGTSLGTPAYMAPEQAAGDEVDHRTDIYAWGVVAYEVLTGEHPFGRRHSAQAYLAAHLVEPPAPVAQRSPGCPPALAALVAACLEKDPADRPGTVRDVLVRIDAVATPVTGTHPRQAEPMHRITSRAFRLTNEVCRQIDRTLLDPRMLGGEMQWLDNGAESDTLIVCVHGTGLSGEMFRDVLEHLPYRVVAPTLFGFGPDERRRVPLSLETHIALLRELAMSISEEVQPRRTILLGFSSGGDIVMRLLAHSEGRRIACDALVALGPNLAVETCWLTRRLARIESVDEASLLEDLRGIALTSATVHEWLNVHEYIVRVLRKFQHDFEPLRVVASGFAGPFEEAGREVFPAWYRAVSARVPVVICVSEDEPVCRSLVEELRLRHLDGGILGPHYREDSLLLESDADHFDLATLPIVERYLKQALARL